MPAGEKTCRPGGPVVLAARGTSLALRVRPPICRTPAGAVELVARDKPDGSGGYSWGVGCGEQRVLEDWQFR